MLNRIAFDSAVGSGGVLARLKLVGELARVKAELKGANGALARLKLSARANQIRAELGAAEQPKAVVVAIDYSAMLTPAVIKELQGSVLAAKYEGNSFARIDSDRIISLFVDTLSNRQYKDFDYEKAEDVLFAKLEEIERQVFDSIFGDSLAMDSISGPAIARANPAVLPMDKPLREILRAAREYAIRKFLGHQVRNRNDGAVILIDKTGLDHGLSNGAGLVDALVVTDLESLLAGMTHIRSEPDKRNRPDIVAIHRYGATVEVQGENMPVGVVVREKKDGRYYYDHFILRPRA
jgi:hypothetical protein